MCPSTHIFQRNDFECLIFAHCDDVAKLGKASWDAYDQEELLIL